VMLGFGHSLSSCHERRLLDLVVSPPRLVESP
jgi:hypothetical protein